MRFSFVLLLLLCVTAANAFDDLSAAIANARVACSGIGAQLGEMKTMAGINTAVTGVGTVAGGVALGTGIAKANVDKEAEELEKRIEELKRSSANVPVEHLIIENKTAFDSQLNEFVRTYTAELQQRESELSAAEQKSKNLGNWRTGTLATATATNIAGTVIAGTNKVRGDLKSQIDGCLTTVKTLSAVRMQAQMSNTATPEELARAENIVRACDGWSTVDIDSINKKSTGATVSAGVGAGLGLAGTITSASANSQLVHDGDTDKEKNLNTVANVLAGGTTVASGVATVFNATQIGAIKRAASVADECEGALR